MADDDDLGTSAPGKPAEQPDSGVGSAARGVAATGGVIATVLAAIRLGRVIAAREIVALAEAAGGKASIPIQSTAIGHIKFELSSGDLEVTLKDGSVYFYPAFPMYLLVQWLNSRSKGSFYNQYVRGMHHYIMGKKKGWKMPLG